MHYPRQQNCAIDVLQQMEDNGEARLAARLRVVGRYYFGLLKSFVGCDEVLVLIPDRAFFILVGAWWLKCHDLSFSYQPDK